MKHSLLFHWKSNKFKIRDLDEVLGVYFTESELIWVIHTLSHTDIQDSLNIAVTLVLKTEADINLFALIFKDEGLVRCLQSDNCPLCGVSVEFLTELLKANLLLIVQVADYGEHGAT